MKALYLEDINKEFILIDKEKPTSWPWRGGGTGEGCCSEPS
ncbi:hypothetical protein [Pontibacter rugosus]